MNASNSSRGVKTISSSAHAGRVNETGRVGVPRNGRWNTAATGHARKQPTILFGHLKVKSTAVDSNPAACFLFSLWRSSFISAVEQSRLHVHKVWGHICSLSFTHGFSLPHQWPRATDSVCTAFVPSSVRCVPCHSISQRDNSPRVWYPQQTVAWRAASKVFNVSTTLCSERYIYVPPIRVVLHTTAAALNGK